MRFIIGDVDLMEYFDLDYAIIVLCLVFRYLIVPDQYVTQPISLEHRATSSPVKSKLEPWDKVQCLTSLDSTNKACTSRL